MFFALLSKSNNGCDGDRRLMDGVVVTKESIDPHEDFRVSMVDMIVEKGIFGVEELENLVECFVKLNSEEHHKVIFEVFAEIWESLVSDM
ncbi:transcription repressor OFP8-like protein [Tanacetum coccineum]